MIRIIADFDQLVKETDELSVSNVKDYVYAYACILESFEKKEDLKVYVQLPAVEYWFKQMGERYPEGSFAFEYINARIRLQELWDIPIPETVNPTDIIEAGLLDFETTPNPGIRFEDFLLEAFYDPLYLAREFPISKLVELLDAFDELKWTQNKQIRLIYRTYLDRITRWKNESKTPELKELINRLSSHPQALKIELIKYKVFKFYKDLGNKLLGKDYALYNDLHLNLVKLQVNEKDIPEVITQVTYLLKGFDEPTTNEEINSLINSVSGYLMIEFEMIEDFIIKSPELLSTAIIHNLEDKFISLQHRLGKRIARLNNLIQPEKPKTPDKNWGIDQILVWATQEYLPYQAWCDSNNISDPTLYELADVFSEWLYENWHEISANSKRMVFNILPNNAIQLGKDKTINLILVIDNLAWTLVSNLEELFQEHGFYLTQVEPYISMIPSETEISKKCLLSGSPTYQGIDNKSYTAIIEKGWVPYFNRAEFRYLSDPGRLYNLKEIDAQTYVVNYRALDTALHMSSAQLGLPHRQHIQNLLVGFVDNVVDFVKKHSLEEKIRVHIVTDHGSLRISEQVPNDINPESFKNDDFPHISHRFVTVTNRGFKKLHDNLKADCFFIPSTEFGNPTHHLCARRANRFLPTDDKFYVHGGLSPEEVVVPHLIFEAALSPLQDMTLILEKTEFRYRMENFKLEIGNPNDYPVENIHISILNSNFEMEPQKIEWLNKHNKISLLMRGLFKKTANPEERKSLSFMVRYECHGKNYSQTTKVPIEMKEIVELRDTSIFDDLD